MKGRDFPKSTFISMGFLKSTSCPWEWDGCAHKPGLTHLSLVCSPGPTVVLCVHYQ